MATVNSIALGPFGVSSFFLLVSSLRRFEVPLSLPVFVVEVFHRTRSSTSIFSRSPLTHVSARLINRSLIGLRSLGADEQCVSSLSKIYLREHQGYFDSDENLIFTSISGKIWPPSVVTEILLDHSEVIPAVTVPAIPSVLYLVKSGPPVFAHGTLGELNLCSALSEATFCQTYHSMIVASDILCSKSELQSFTVGFTNELQSLSLSHLDGKPGCTLENFGVLEAMNAQAVDSRPVFLGLDREAQYQCMDPNVISLQYQGWLNPPTPSCVTVDLVLHRCLCKSENSTNMFISPLVGCSKRSCSFNPTGVCKLIRCSSRQDRYTLITPIVLNLNSKFIVDIGALHGLNSVMVRVYFSSGVCIRRVALSCDCSYHHCPSRRGKYNVFSPLVLNLVSKLFFGMSLYGTDGVPDSMGIVIVSIAFGYCRKDPNLDRICYRPCTACVLGIVAKYKHTDIISFGLLTGELFVNLATRILTFQSDIPVSLDSYQRNYSDKAADHKVPMKLGQPLFNFLGHKPSFGLLVGFEPQVVFYCFILWDVWIYVKKTIVIGQ